MKNILRRKWVLCLCMTIMCLMACLATQKITAKAAGDYYARINKGTNVVTIYRSNGTPYKAFVCSTGAATPIGTFYTSQKLRWHELDGPTYGQYCTRITGHILFHSVWYYRMGDVTSQSYVQYNRLGTTASHGCVRLTVADAKWIYDNCPLGLRVEIFYGGSGDDPLGKPSFMRVNGYMGWDPTDPAPGNPYARLFPSINTSGKATTVSYGSAFDHVAGIVAKDSAGNDISGSITYNGWVNTNKLGTYTVSYSVTDALGRVASASVTYYVVDDRSATISGVKSKLTKEYNTTYNVLSKIKASTVDKKNLTKKIKVKVKAPGSKSAKNYKKKTLKLSKTGTYKIYYTVTNPNNNKVSTKVTTIKVVDTKKPKLSGVKSKKTQGYNTVLNLKKGVTAKLVSGKSMTSKIKIEIKAPGSKKYKTLKDKGNDTVNYKKYRFKKTGNYYVRYSVTNPSKKSSVTKKTLKITVKDFGKPKLSGVKKSASYEYGKVVNLRSKITAKLPSGPNVTSKMIVKVKVPGSKKYVTLQTNGDVKKNNSSTKYRFGKVGTYTILYRVENPNKKSVYVEQKTTITIRDNAKPAITGVSNSKTITEGEALNLLSGVKASIPSKSSISVTVTVKNAANGAAVAGNVKNFVFSKPGTYNVLYEAVNPGNKKSVTKKTMKVYVKEKPDNATPVISGVAETKTIEEGAALDLTSGVEASIPSNPSLAVTVKVLDAQGAEVAGDAKNFTFQTAGTYQVVYEAVNPNNNASAKKTMQVVVTEKIQEPDPAPDPALPEAGR